MTVREYTPISSYIFDRDPHRFADPTEVGHREQLNDRQTRYVELSKTIAKETSEQFRAARKSERGWKAVFDETLSRFGSIRHDLAVQQGNPDAALFGARRDVADSFGGNCGMTSLYSPYEAYNDRLLPVFQTYLSSMQHTKKEFQQKELKVPGKECLGRASSLDVNIFSVEDQEDWGFEFSAENYQRLCSLCSFSPSEEPFDPSHVNNLTANKAAMEMMKVKAAKAYKSLKVCSAISELRETFKDRGRKSDWAVITVRTQIKGDGAQIKGAMYALSQYITWMYRDYAHDPVERMTDNATIAIIHQDPFLIDNMLCEIASVFEEVMTWDGQNMKNLTDNVALFQYLLAHTMPFGRGLSAAAEWFEMAIYGSYGLEVSYNPEKMVNLEALTLPLPEFVSGYSSMIRLTPINTPEIQRV